MNKCTILIGLLFMTLICRGQSSDISKDTILLKEVVVSSVLPLNDNDVVDFYRPNQFSTLDNINSRLEGMSVIKRGAYALEPQLNGFSGGQLNVTIDGMKMFGACTDKMDPITSYVEPTNLKSITISKGTSGCHHGSNIGGSLDMTLQEPVIQSPYSLCSFLGYGYESIAGSRNVLFSSSYGTKNWAWQINGVYRKNENYRDGNNQVVPFTQFEKTNLHSVIRYSVSRASSFKADLLYDVAHNVGYPALPMDVSLARATLLALEYQRKGKAYFKAKAYYNRIYHKMDDSKRDSLYLLKNSQDHKSDSVYMRMDMPGISSTAGAYFQIEIPWKGKNNMIFKADNYTNHSLAEMTMFMRYAGFPAEAPMYMQTWPEMLRNVSGFYIQNTTFLSSKTSVSVNGRIDYNVDILQSYYGQQQFSIFNYSVKKTQGRFLKSLNASFQYRLLENFSMTASLGYAERVPAIGERFGFYLFNAYDGYDYIGNPDLANEKSRFFSWSFQLSEPNVKISLNPSFSWIRDYILGLTDTVIPALNFYARGIRVYSNVPKAMLYSVDLQAMLEPVKHLSVFANSKFTYGKLKSKEPMPLIPPLKTIAAIQFQTDQFSIQVESESALAQNRINLDYRERTTPAFTVINLKSSYSLIVSKTVIDIGITARNIFNRVYYEHLDWRRINRPGRSIDILFRLSI